MTISDRKRIMMIFTAIITAVALYSVLACSDVYANTSTKSAVTKYASNIRSGAGTGYKRIATLKKGKTITVRGSKKTSGGKTWYYFTYKGKTRYIISGNVKIQSTSVTYSAKKKGVTRYAVNVRSGPSTSYKRYGTLSKGSAITLKGYKKLAGNSKWYRITYNSKTRYVEASYVTIASDVAGFPESYQSKLSILQAAHPNWVFKPQNTGIAWSSALAYEYSNGNNVYSSGGTWKSASKNMVAYYFDPRNSLSEGYVFQFLNHSFDSSTQSTTTVRQVAGSSFINTSAYIDLIYTAGKEAGVNPNVLAAMIIQEQGIYGSSSLISGKYTDTTFDTAQYGSLTGLYNYFNIGAYTTSAMTTVQRGLWWAGGQMKNGTIQYSSYLRPWNTVEKAIKGGALYYYSNYVGKNQNTLYLKKFNVMNGLSKVGTHQYMTHVAGAYGEGKKLSRADDYTYVFYIPVFTNMPSSPCAYSAT